ncbi:DUF305 domain-containing protein [Antribacter gilvus]|uniref:DUF305 domain-containing protein n=1 Tax=Antribacter gilvus TaxID=2304675 RepID=UPI000F7BADF9|nr:DUF305 domain-containing protein [Antribacter gilvus]
MKRIFASLISFTTVLGLAACGASANTGGSGEFNDADVMFAQMMIPHHEQAIEMSDLVGSKSGLDPEIAALAEQVKAAQAPEIDKLNAWLEEWGAAAGDMDGMDHGMDGMMSEDDLKALADADGTTAGDLFLEQMIDHHEGAVDMAETEVADGANAEAIAMAESIIESQTAEIEKMQSLLTK